MPVCINHPEVEAQAHCMACLKPICGDCVVSDNGQAFCSTKCAVRQRDSMAALARDQARARRLRRIKLVVRLVLLLVAAAIGYVAWGYFTKNPDRIQELKKTAAELQEAAVNKATDAIDTHKAKEEQRLREVEEAAGGR